MRFGQFHAARSPTAGAPDGLGEHVVLGIRPEAFEDAAFAPGLPTIRARIEVLEELGSDVHVFFHVDAAPISAEILEAAAGGGLPDGRALFTARVDAADGRSGRRLRSSSPSTRAASTSSIPRPARGSATTAAPALAAAR